MGKDFFATGLQKKMEKIGEDFLRGGAVGRGGRTNRADRVVRPYSEAGRRIRIRQAYSEKSASSWVCLGAAGRPGMRRRGS